MTNSISVNFSNFVAQSRDNSNSKKRKDAEQTRPGARETHKSQRVGSSSSISSSSSSSSSIQPMIAQNTPVANSLPPMPHPFVMPYMPMLYTVPGMPMPFMMMPYPYVMPTAGMGSLPHPFPENFSTAANPLTTLADIALQGAQGDDVRTRVAVVRENSVSKKINEKILDLIKGFIALENPTDKKIKEFVLNHFKEDKCEIYHKKNLGFDNFRALTRYFKKEGEEIGRLGRDLSEEEQQTLLKNAMESGRLVRKRIFPNLITIARPHAAKFIKHFTGLERRKQNHENSFVALINGFIELENPTLITIDELILKHFKERKMESYDKKKLGLVNFHAISSYFKKEEEERKHLGRDLSDEEREILRETEMRSEKSVQKKIFPNLITIARPHSAKFIRHFTTTTQIKAKDTTTWVFLNPSSISPAQ